MLACISFASAAAEGPEPRRTSIFSKMILPSHLKITAIFTTFGSLIGIVVDSKNFFWSPMIPVMRSKLLFWVIVLQKKQLKVKTWFQTFQYTSSFWELPEPSKKVFLKCQQATSNPKIFNCSERQKYQNFFFWGYL